MPILGFDTETSGFVLAKEKPSHKDQPFLVQLGVTLWDAAGDERSYASIIIHPDGRDIPTQASDVHGITTAIANEVGVPLDIGLATFSQFCKVATEVVGHNIEFDLKVMQAEFHRRNRPFPTVVPRCTKDMSESILKLPPTARMVQVGFGHKFKAPTLTECIAFFFNEELPGAHDALVDARACMRVFHEIRKRQQT